MRRALLAALISVLLAATAAAESMRGPVTNLPLPRFVSVKASEANVRRGPGLGHRIDWVFTRRHLPLEVTAEYGHWRRVRDIEGAGGWVHYSLLSGVRYVLITAPDTALRRKPDPGAPIAARAEAGVVAELGDCLPDWCHVTAEGIGGWARKDQFWGVEAEELRD